MTTPSNISRNTLHDYESFAYVPQATCPTLEAVSGSRIVDWYGTIDQRLDQMVSNLTKERNFNASARVHQFLQTWRENKLEGGLNVEPVVALLTATQQLAADRTWKEQDFFIRVRNALQTLKASVEQLPMGAEMTPPGEIPAAGGVPPPSEFGPGGGAPPAETPAPAGEPETPPDEEARAAAAAAPAAATPAPAAP